MRDHAGLGTVRDHARFLGRFVVVILVAFGLWRGLTRVQPVKLVGRACLSLLPAAR